MFLAWDKQTAPEVAPCHMSGGLLRLNKNSSRVCLSSSLICHPEPLHLQLFIVHQKAGSSILGKILHSLLLTKKKKSSGCCSYYIFLLSHPYGISLFPRSICSRRRCDLRLTGWQWTPRNGDCLPRYFIYSAYVLWIFICCVKLWYCWENNACLNEALNTKKGY